ncbi:MAG: uncharacterized protein K0S05_830 [Agromyces sp.]|nr:uncharacterized protein [Agromyces sp.]
MMTLTNGSRSGGRRSRAAAGVGTAVAGMLLMAGCATSGSGSGDPAMNGHGQETHQSEASGDWNQADVMFAQMMIPHHEQAIEMSDLILAKDGVDAEVVDLAEQIKAAQGPEIEQMQSWLEDWEAPSMSDGDMGMEGLLSEEEMDDLESADAATGTTLFLEGMIEHHEGAVEMAEEHQENGRSEEALDLSAAVIETQTAEIDLMRQLLEG